MVEEMIRPLSEEEQDAVLDAIDGRLRHLERIGNEHIGAIAKAAYDTHECLMNARALLEHCNIL